MRDSVYHFGFYLLIAQWLLRDARHVISGLERAVVCALRSVSKVRGEYNRLFRIRNGGNLESIPQDSRQHLIK
jgi:hypothetical protein